MTHRRTSTAAEQTAEYLATMCNQLAELAERDGFPVGAYLLKMAQLEFVGQTVAHEPTADHANR